MKRSKMIFINIYITCFICLLIQATSARGFGPPTTDHSKVELKKMVRLGSNVKLLCPMSGQPNIIINWSKDGEAIKDYSWERFHFSKKTLKIVKVTMEDTGIYVCKGTNGFGSEEIRIDVIVYDPKDYLHLNDNEGPEVVAPILTIETEESKTTYRRVVGENFKLECEALGKPDPEIIWYKNGEELNFDGSRGKSILSIRNLNMNNAGLYTCTAVNEGGEISKNFNLDVVYGKNQGKRQHGDSGSLLDRINSREDTLKMSTGRENTTVTQGSKATLECRVHSPVETKITWLKRLEQRSNLQSQEEVIVIGNDKFKVLQQGLDGDFSSALVGASENGVEYLNTLVIEEASLETAGTYFCFVKNAAGYKFKSAYLTVIPKSITTIGSDSGLESGSVLILGICLSLVAAIIIVAAVILVMRKKQKRSPNSSNNTSSSGSDGNPELTENLMRQQQVLPGVYVQQQPSMMHRNIIQHQGQYHHPPAPPNSVYQPIPYTNNNHRNGGQMSIVVNKMSEPNLPPPPQPPKQPGSRNDWIHSQGLQLYGGGETSSGHMSNTSMNNYNIYHMEQSQQNQYEVPHVHDHLRSSQRVYRPNKMNF